MLVLFFFEFSITVFIIEYFIRWDENIQNDQVTGYKNMFKNCMFFKVKKLSDK